MILNVCHWWVIGLWAVFFVYWIVAAFFAKRGRDPAAARKGIAARAVIAVAIVASYSLAARLPGLRALQLAQLRSVPMAATGAVIVTIGAIFAFTARAAIGRNWGTPGSRKMDTELVTSGPYSLVRHPIYTGILLMMIGTAIALIPLWWIIAAASGTYMIASARSEERHLAERFPDDYPAYRARTKMLLPFLF